MFNALILMTAFKRRYDDILNITAMLKKILWTTFIEGSITLYKGVRDFCVINRISEDTIGIIVKVYVRDFPTVIYP